MELRSDNTVLLHQKQDYAGRFQLNDKLLSVDLGGWGMKMTLDGARLTDTFGRKTGWVKQCFAVPEC